MLYRIKGEFQNFANLFVVRGMTPNHATVLGILCSAAVAFGLYLGLSGNTVVGLWLVPPLTLLRIVFNALDGLLARKSETATPAGELANELSDVFCDTGIFLAFYGFVNGLILIGVLVLLWAAEFVGVLGRGLPGHQRRHESLGGGKTERAVWVSVIAVAAALQGEAFNSDAWLGALAGFILITVIYRVFKILKFTRGKPYVSFTPHGR